MKRRTSSPDVVALIILTAALLWLVPELQSHVDWLPFHTEWSGIRLPMERATRLPLLPLQ